MEQLLSERVWHNFELLVKILITPLNSETHEFILFSAWQCHSSQDTLAFCKYLSEKTTTLFVSKYVTARNVAVAKMADRTVLRTTYGIVQNRTASNVAASGIAMVWSCVRAASSCSGRGNLGGSVFHWVLWLNYTSSACWLVRRKWWQTSCNV